jgi:rRNA maturation endonuclease Nob1
MVPMGLHHIYWHMRPEPTDESVEMYECWDCGERVSEPDGRLCRECGGSLNNLGRGRDL